LPEALLHAALGREVPERRSVTEPGAAPSGCFRCAGADSWLALSVKTEDDWRGLCRVMADAGLDDQLSVSSAEARLAAKQELNARVAAWLRTRDAAEVEAALHAQGVPASRSRNMREIVGDPHMRERAMFSEIDGEVQMATLPWLASDWRGAFTPTPAIGQDNDYVFGTLLGLSAERRAELAAEGTIR
jgi:benzylsuccinate CoA-transferase BbsF subunit